MNFITINTNKAQINIENDYLNNIEIEEIVKKIDTGITNIENYINIYINSPIEYYIKNGNFISCADDHKILLSFVKEKRSPYLHETVHVIAKPKIKQQWLEEGLSVYLNEKLSGDPCFPNGEIPIDEFAKFKYDNLKYFTREFDFTKINNDFEFKTKYARSAFYIFSGSFVKYLDKKIGIENFMKIYNCIDLDNDFLKITGKTINEFKNEWEDYIKLINIDPNLFYKKIKFNN